jgi:hypothetical protein
VGSCPPTSSVAALDICVNRRLPGGEQGAGETSSKQH